MKNIISRIKLKHLLLVTALIQILPSAYAADKELLDILLQNSAITQEQYNGLIEQASFISSDILGQPSALESVIAESVTEEMVTAEVSEKIENEFPVTASRDSSGFRLETHDGNWQTNLQWRAQMRFTTPYRSDPRQVSSLNVGNKSNFEARRLRIKIGGHGIQPWIKYYFEVDLQPSRDISDSSSSSSARVIEYWSVESGF